VFCDCTRINYIILFLTYSYLDNTTGMTHLKIMNAVLSISYSTIHNCVFIVVLYFSTLIFMSKFFSPDGTKFTY